MLDHFMPRSFCSHVAVTKWGKFGRVFCKQTSVAADRFQNECTKGKLQFVACNFGLVITF